jgi:hypothetical protein
MRHVLGKGRPWRFGRGNTVRTEMPETVGRWRIVGPSMSLGNGARWSAECVLCGGQVTARGTDLRRNRVACPGCKAKEEARP